MNRAATEPSTSAERYDLSTPAALARDLRERLEAQRGVLAQGLKVGLRRLLRLPLQVEVGEPQACRARRLAEFEEGSGWWYSGGPLANPREKSVFLGASAGLVMASVDRLFGGPGRTEVPPRSPSAIELKFGRKFLGDVMKSVADLLREPPLRLEVAGDQGIDEPLGIFLRDAEEVFVQLPITVAIDDSEQALSLALARPLLGRVAPPSPSPAAAARLPAAIGQVDSILEAELARCRLSIEETRKLQPGDVLLFPVPAGKPVELRVQGKTRFRARLGTHDQHYAVEVIEVVGQPPPAATPEPSAAVPEKPRAGASEKPKAPEPVADRKRPAPRQAPPHG